MPQVPFITSETNVASYLVLKGYKLLGIQYEPRQNGKRRGFFIFEASDKIDEDVKTFESGDVTVNFTEYENIKSGLLDRIMGGLP